MWNWLKKLFTPPTKVDKSLGERDFGDWTLQTYEEVEDREGITQKATTAARKEEPDSSLTTDLILGGLKIKFNKEVKQKEDEIKRQVSILKTDLSLAEARDRDFKTIKDKYSEKIKHIKSGFKEIINQAKKLMVDQRDSLDNFVHKNRLDRPAKVPIAPALFWVILLGILLLESIANGAFLGDLVRGGFAQGILVAMAIAVINIFIGVSTGIFTRNINSIFTSRKLFGVLVILIWLIGTIFFNLFVGHFRDAVGAAGWEQGLVDAPKTFFNWSTVFILTDAMSWFLVTVGIIFSFIALYDGYGKDDPYPGYGSKTKQLEIYRENYLSHLSEANDEQNKCLEEAIKLGGSSLDNIGQNLRTFRQSLTFLTGRIEDQFPAFCENHAEIFKQLIENYRQTNMNLRETEPPAYFNSAPTFKWKRLDFEETFQEMEETYESLKGSTKKSEESWPKIQQTLRGKIQNFTE